MCNVLHLVPGHPDPGGDKLWKPLFSQGEEARELGLQHWGEGGQGGGQVGLQGGGQGGGCGQAWGRKFRRFQTGSVKVGYKV